MAKEQKGFSFAPLPANDQPKAAQRRHQETSFDKREMANVSVDLAKKRSTRNVLHDNQKTESAKCKGKAEGQKPEPTQFVSLDLVSPEDGVNEVAGSLKLDENTPGQAGWDE